jgi:hypothetical protein
LVTLAIGRCSSAFCSYKTVPVDASIRIDDLTSGVRDSAKTHKLDMSIEIIKAKINTVFFTKVHRPL